MINPNSAQEIQAKKEQAYQKLVEKNAPPQQVFSNCLKAFLVGGLICTIAQFVQYGFLTYFDFTKETVGSPTSAVMILLAIILTCCGVYDKIAQFAGAGTAVPITGFANAMSSAALEYRSEGFVLGVGGNMFKVAGPVIVFGAVSAFLMAIAVVLFRLIFG